MNKNPKKEKKISPYDIERQNNKLYSLERRLQFLINSHVELKEKFNTEMKEYKEACEKLEIKEKNDAEIPQYKKDVKKMNNLEKEKKELIMVLERLKNEHLSIKQTLDEYEEKKNKLKVK